MYKILAFTGLRPQKLSFKNDETHSDYIVLKEKMRNIIIDLIENQNVRFFVSGLALGIDQIAAQIIIELRKIYDIKLEAAIPCLAQDKPWSENEKVRYKELLSKCDEVHMCSTNEYKDGCMQIRNQYMVIKADIVLAVWDGQWGGTYSTVRFVRERKKKLIILNNKTLKITEEN